MNGASLDGSSSPRREPGGAPSRRKMKSRMRGLACVEGILQGKSYQQVADEQGYASRGTVHRIVQEALSQRVQENIDDLRALELARLGALQAAFYPAALSGDLKAAEMVLKVIVQRSRLLQLERVLDAAGPAQLPLLVGGTKEEFIAALKAGRAQQD